MTDYQNIMIAVGFIVILLIMSVIIRKRSSGVRRADMNAVKIINTLALSSKEKILLIEVRHQQLLVGVTANNISTLKIFDEQKSDLSYEKISNWQQNSPNILRNELET